MLEVIRFKVDLTNAVIADTLELTTLLNGFDREETSVIFALKDFGVARSIVANAEVLEL